MIIRANNSVTRPHCPPLRQTLLSLAICLFPSITLLAQEAPPAEREPLSDIVQLTTGLTRAGEAYFSPDMKWIIFQAVPAGQDQYQMYVAELKWDGEKIAGTGKPIRISPDKSRNTCGYFSPDGKSLIFASTAGKDKSDEPSGGYQRQGGNYRWSFPSGMEIFRADDWLAKLKAAGLPDQINLATTPITNNNVYDAECAYSPDGKWICFASGVAGDTHIYVMRPDGTGRVQITSAKGYNGGPFFSPDGKRLLYRCDRKGNDLLQLFVADLAIDDKGDITGRKAERQITDDANVNWGPYWHPDGRHIIYSTSKHGHHNYELYMMRDDGSAQTRITYAPGPDILPVFSPDGKWLMWTCRRAKDSSVQVFAARFKMPE